MRRGPPSSLSPAQGIYDLDGMSPFERARKAKSKRHEMQRAAGKELAAREAVVPEQATVPQEQKPTDQVRGKMDVAKWKRSLLGIDTSAETQSSFRSPEMRLADMNTPDTARSKRRNKWEKAASLMFKKEAKKKNCVMKWPK